MSDSFFAGFSFWSRKCRSKIPVSVELSGEIPAQDETYTVKLSALDQAPVPKDDTLKITGGGDIRLSRYFLQQPRHIRL